MKLLRPLTIDATALVSSNVAETHALYSGATSYADGDIVRSEPSTGTVLFESLVGSNVGNPLTDATKWLPLGASNRWKLFDRSVTSQTTNADDIEVVIQTVGRVDSVAILNVNAASVQVVAADATDGVVFDETYSLVSSSGITDIFAWLTEPIERLADYYVTGLPTLYANLELTITIASPGGTAMCGGLVVGLSREVGGAQYGATVGIQDYSRKITDTFGNLTVFEGAFSKRGNFTVFVDSALTDQVQVLLARYRATPIVYVGSEAYGSTLIYGFYRDSNVEIAGPNHSILSIEIEGLT